MDKLSYALGNTIAHQLVEMGLKGKLVVADYATAINDVFGDVQPPYGAADLQQTLSDFFASYEAQQKREMAKRGEAAKAEGENYLAANAKREGVHTTASGLQYEILAEGNGRHPKSTDTVRCHYEGRLIDGSIFDSSYLRNQPAEFPLNQVISGWTEGLQLMGEGAKFRFHIPYHLAYGERGAGQSIPPFATLVFTVELIKVI